jgi:vacuolar protein 8
MENACFACFSAIDRWCHISACLGSFGGRSRDGIYETILQDSEREAVADLLQYLENVRSCTCFLRRGMIILTIDL